MKTAKPTRMLDLQLLLEKKWILSNSNKIGQALGDCSERGIMKFEIFFVEILKLPQQYFTIFELLKGLEEALVKWILTFSGAYQFMW